jgi:hypothetical protein
MTIGRRDVMSWGALGLGAAAVGGCGDGVRSRKSPIVGGAAPPTASPEDVERLLAELDRVLLEMKSIESEAGRAARARGVADGATRETTCTRLLTTLCVMGTYRDVPRSMWQEPRVEERLARTMPDIHATIGAARKHLVDITDNHGARIDRQLREDPDLTMRIMERIDEEGKRIHIPLEQRLHLRAATTQLSGRLRFEGTKDVTAGLVARFDRAVASRRSLLAKEGNPDAPPDPAPSSVASGSASAPAPAPPPPPDGMPPAWPPALAQPRPELAPSPRAPARPLGEAGESCRTSADCEESLCGEGVCRTRERVPRSERLNKTTKKVAIVGLRTLIPPICAIGVLVLLTCLFMVIVAGAMSASGD